MMIGVPLGLFAGFYGGWVDATINVLLQIVRSIPIFFLLLVLSVLFRPTPLGLAVMLGVLGWTNTARQVRAIAFSVKNREYVDAARALGAQDYRIILRHILPNLSSIILVIAGFDIASAILTEAGLSFLGFGVQPPIPSWGNMLSDSLENARSAPWLIVSPGVFITTTVLCIFLFSDGLRDAFDTVTGKQ
ncbi:MAG: ABC transporter permease [Chloroflexi bacterium]|uniref:ABC transporter permease n=1 Tax=Candidatus Flexifilum breve TaxID=3140694 RepID=UPI003136B7AE|nr:ABC transporter permease [Chloroflexota bacterium]